MCHQENANWPFGENLKLKEIFDQLFQTDQYSKFVECARKVAKTLKKSLAVESKVMQEMQFKYQDTIRNKKIIYSKLQELIRIRKLIGESEEKFAQ